MNQWLARYIDWQNGKATHEELAELFTVIVAASLAHRAQGSEVKPYAIN